MLELRVLLSYLSSIRIHMKRILASHFIKRLGEYCGNVCGLSSTQFLQRRMESSPAFHGG